MIELESPITFISEIIDVNSKTFVFSIPQFIQNKIKEKRAKFIYIKFIKFLDEKS